MCGKFTTTTEKFRMNEGKSKRKNKWQQKGRILITAHGYKCFSWISFMEAQNSVVKVKK